MYKAILEYYSQLCSSQTELLQTAVINTFPILYLRMAKCFPILHQTDIILSMSPKYLKF